MPSKQPNPTTLRIPEEWEPEIEAARNRKGLKRHAWLLRAIRRVLDGEKNFHKPSDVSPNLKGKSS